MNGELRSREYNVYRGEGGRGTGEGNCVAEPPHPPTRATQILGPRPPPNQYQTYPLPLPVLSACCVHPAPRLSQIIAQGGITCLQISTRGEASTTQVVRNTPPKKHVK